MKATSILTSIILVTVSTLAFAGNGDPRSQPATELSYEQIAYLAPTTPLEADYDDAVTSSPALLVLSALAPDVPGVADYDDSVPGWSVTSSRGEPVFPLSADFE